LARVVRERARNVRRSNAHSIFDRVIELAALLRCNLGPASLCFNDAFDALASPVTQRRRRSASIELHAFFNCLEDERVLLRREIDPLFLRVDQMLDNLLGPLSRPSLGSGACSRSLIARA